MRGKRAARQSQTESLECLGPAEARGDFPPDTSPGHGPSLAKEGGVAVCPVVPRLLLCGTVSATRSPAAARPCTPIPRSVAEGESASPRVWPAPPVGPANIREHI